MSELAILFSALPQILRLIRTIKKGIDEAETQRKVKDDLKTIEEAFRAKDANALNKLFSSL